VSTALVFLMSMGAERVRAGVGKPAGPPSGSAGMRRPTSSAVSGLPLWNVMPGFSLISHWVNLLLVAVIDFASMNWVLALASICTSGSYRGLEAGGVLIGEALMRVDVVRGPAAGEPCLQVAAPLSMAGHRAGARRAGATAGREQAARAGERAGGGDPPKELAPVQRRCGEQPSTLIRSIHEITLQ